MLAEQETESKPGLLIHFLPVTWSSAPSALSFVDFFLCRTALLSISAAPLESGERFLANEAGFAGLSGAR